MNGDDLENELRQALGYGDEPDDRDHYCRDIELLVVACCVVVVVAVGWLLAIAGI